VIAELGEQVQHTLWYRPAESEMTTNFCAGIVGNEQHIGVRRIGGSYAKLVPPASDLAPTFQFPCHQAYRLGVLAGSATELKVDHPNLFEGKKVEWVVRRHRCTGSPGGGQALTGIEWLQSRQHRCDGVDGLLVCRSRNIDV
jgi:hypothetical protein